VSFADTGRTTLAARLSAVAADDAAAVTATFAQRKAEAARVWLVSGAHDHATARHEFGVELPNHLLAPGRTVTVAAVEAAGVASGHALADVRAAVAEALRSGTLTSSGTTLTRKAKP
jgi:hypothetical protein